jgi:hypothetical protein
VNIDWAEWGYRISAFFMGLFTVFMVVSLVVYFDESETSAISIFFFLAILGSYAVPLILHCGELSVIDFLKGIVYLIFLSPTYINIISLYSICNIHDISWGSRPAGDDVSKASKRDINMSIDYKNYRSQFLVVWAASNASIGFIVVLISRSGQQSYLFFFAAILTVMIGFKLICSFLHSCLSR